MCSSDLTPLDANFYDTKLEGSYAKKNRDMEWGAGLEFQHQLYNWYGVAQEEFDPALISGLDETQIGRASCRERV